jgi:hypothetical protein
MRPTSLLQDYHDLRESGSTSDYPNILGNLMGRRMIDWAQAAPQKWRQYSAIGTVPDFRPQTMIVGYESEDLLPIGEEGVYQDSKLADASFQLQVGTYGRAFSINRNVIINDDLNYIRQQPQRFGRAAGRGLAKFAARTLLEGNANTFDGQPLFGTAHANLGTGAGSVFGGNNLKVAITALSTQTVLNQFMTMDATMLVVPPALQWDARQLLNSAVVAITGTPAANAVIERGTENVLRGALDIVVEPFLTSATAYYVLANPNEAPVIDVAFLNGKQTPDLLVERPVMTNVAGGDDPYEFEFDVMRYKVRFDYGGAVSRWWGGYKFDGA